jgi:hypothetical protein
VTDDDILHALEAEVAALRFSEREWKDKALDKIAEVEQWEQAELATIRDLTAERDELLAERRSLVAYLGETADAIENHNVKRKQVAALLRKTVARYP